MAIVGLVYCNFTFFQFTVSSLLNIKPTVGRVLPI